MKSNTIRFAAVLGMALVTLRSDGTAWGQGEHLAPSTHGKKPGTPPGTQVPPRRIVPAAPTNPFGNLQARLGLTAGKSLATGRYFAVHANGAIAHLSGNYQYRSDGRLMLFPAGTNLRIDVHSAKFYPKTMVFGAKYIDINPTTARNTGGGIINFGVGGSGNVIAQMQEQFMIVGTQWVRVNSQIQTIRFIPN